MVTGAKRIKFPSPGATKEKEPVTTISAERMLVHYNQDHPTRKKPAKRVTDKITNHTSVLAKQAGWIGATVAKDAVSGHTSAMLLLRAQKTTVRADVVDVEPVPSKALPRPKE